MNKQTISPYSKIPIGPSVKHGKNFAPNTFTCTFLGESCQQTFNAFFIWEKLLCKLDFKRFIELGTALGNMSVYFKLFCINRNAKFYTYDFGRKNNITGTPVQKFVDLKGSCNKVDIFVYAKEIKEIISKPGITIILCDGGDKVHELRTFAPSLKKGDIIACHDWGRDIKTSIIQPEINKYNLKELLQKERKELNTATGIFIKK